MATPSQFSKKRNGKFQFFMTFFLLFSLAWEENHFPRIRCELSSFMLLFPYISPRRKKKLTEKAGKQTCYDSK